MSDKNLLTTSISVTPPDSPLVSVSDLVIQFRTERGRITAVDHVSFDLLPGQSMAVVGESGSGKSTLVHALIRLLPGAGEITGGKIVYNGHNVLALNRRQIEHFRGRQVGFVPQDPMQSLNPVTKIGRQVGETIRANGLGRSKSSVHRLTLEALSQAGLPDPSKVSRSYAHQLSGGMQQRVLIGMALSSQPGLLIADEPTSALDVTVQKVILDYLEERTKKLNTALILVTHDLGLAAERAKKLLVMYHGQVVESGPSEEILTNPRHPYTQKLVNAAPGIKSGRLGALSLEERNAQHVDLKTGQLSKPAIAVRKLVKRYPIRVGSFKTSSFTAVDEVSFIVPKGSTTALVGESGSGKSTIAKMVLQLEKPTSGEIEVEGRRIDQYSSSQMRRVRSRLQPVFQNPYGTLDPLRNISATISEPLEIHGVGNRSERKARVRELLDQVSLPYAIRHRYPNELSGGQRQRIAVARALALKPSVMILDEAVSALDVLVQSQVLDLLTDLQQQMGMSYLFITHDLAVVRLIADHVCVMSQGKIVEQARTEEVFENPKSDYTQKLIDAIPGRNVLAG